MENEDGSGIKKDVQFITELQSLLCSWLWFKKENKNIQAELI